MATCSTLNNVNPLMYQTSTPRITRDNKGISCSILYSILLLTQPGHTDSFSSENSYSPLYMASTPCHTDLPSHPLFTPFPHIMPSCYLMEGGTYIIYMADIADLFCFLIAPTSCIKLLCLSW